MDDITLFKSTEFGAVRVFGNSDYPLFCASDICNALGYVNGRKAVADHCDSGDVTKRDTPTASGIQQMTYVNESGMYALIFGSKLERAREFKRWVTSEVLPQIRRTGGYIPARVEDTPEEIMAKALLIANKTVSDQKERISALEKERCILAPKARYTDEVLNSGNTFTFVQMAKELNFKSVNAFITTLKENNIIFRQSGTYMLYSRYAGRGYTTTRTSQYICEDKSVGICTRTVFTEKGRLFLHDFFKRKELREPIDIELPNQKLFAV